MVLTLFYVLRDFIPNNSKIQIKGLRNDKYEVIYDKRFDFFNTEDQRALVGYMDCSIDHFEVADNKQIILLS